MDYLDYVKKGEEKIGDMVFLGFAIIFYSLYLIICLPSFFVGFVASKIAFRE